MKVYEIVDYTDDERYYPLGIFPSMEEAGQALDRLDKEDHRMSWYTQNEFESIVVVEREFGWSENGDEVLRINREEYYNEETDEYLWRRTGQ